MSSLSLTRRNALSSETAAPVDGQFGAIRTKEEALRRLAAIVESSDDAIISKAPDEIITTWNVAAERMFGYQGGEIIGRFFKLLVPPERQEEADAIMAKARAGERVDHLETIRLTKDGRRLDVSVTSSPLKDDAGRIIGASEILRDITERRRVEAERELTISVLDRINSSPDLRTLMREVTDLLLDATGCEAVGIRLRDGDDFPYFETRGFPPEFVQAENKLCATDSEGRLLQDGEGHPILECMCGNILCGRFNAAKPFFTARGSFWTNSTTQLLAGTTEADRQARTRNRCNGEGYESVALIRLRTGGETFGLLQCNDHRSGCFAPEKIAHLERIADQLAAAVSRRQVQQALRRSETKFRALYDSTGDAVMLLSEKGFSDCNPAALAMFGCASREEFCSKHPADLSPPMQPDGTDSLTLANRQIAAALEKGSHRFEWIHQRADTGETFPADVLLSAMELDGRRVLQATVRDITKLKQAEEAVSKALATQSAIFDGTSDFVWSVNSQDFGLLTFNRAFRDHCLRHHGVRLRVGQRPEEILSAVEDVERWRGWFRRALASGPFAIEHVSASGNLALLWAINPLKHKETPFGVAVFGKDISAREQAEQALRASRENLRSLAARVQAVREEERTRVAREIHDVLAQELTSLKIDVTLLTHLLAGLPAKWSRVWSAKN